MTVGTTFTLVRELNNAKSTPGKLMLGTTEMCATLEPDGVRKWYPRIPAGEYPLRIKPDASRFDVSCARDLGDAYKGMIEIVVPGRSHILFHPGNEPHHTEGCVMTGDRVVRVRDHFQIPGGESRPAFCRVYPTLLAAVLSEGGAKLVVIDSKVNDIVAAAKPAPRVAVHSKRK